MIPGFEPAVGSEDIIHLTKDNLTASSYEGLRWFWHTLCITFREEQSS